jgi:hypothetical protein
MPSSVTSRGMSSRRAVPNSAMERLSLSKG